MFQTRIAIPAKTSLGAGTTLAGYEAARSYFAICFARADPTRETLFVAYLDDQAKCVRLSRHDGDSTGVEWPIRSILLEAARRDCAGIVVAHNHPSGDASPSTADRSAAWVKPEGRFHSTR